MSDDIYFKAFEFFGQCIASGEQDPTHKTAEYLHTKFDYNVLLAMMTAVQIKQHWQQVQKDIEQIPW